jgi:hypothetical protein
MGWMESIQLRHSKHIRCPYCADGLDFRVMVRQGRSDWYMCGGCGHLSMPSSPFHQCTCTNCSKLEEKRRMWNHAALNDGISKTGLIDEVPVTLRHLTRLFRRIAVSVY